MSVGLLRFDTIIEKLRTIDPELQMQAALCLSIVARAHDTGGEVTVKDIGFKLGLSSASASRNIAVLSDWNRHDKPGAGLVEAKENPKRRVEKFVTLTRKGEIFIKELNDIVLGKAPTIDINELGESPNKQKHLAKMEARKEEFVKHHKREYEKQVRESKKRSAAAYRQQQERDA